MAAWKSSQRSDSGRTTILASIQVFYSLIQEGGYLTLIIISGSFIQEHQSCSIGQILTTTRATWSSSLPRWTTVNTIHFMFWVGEHFYWRLPARRILLSDKLQVREYRFLTWFWFSWCKMFTLPKAKTKCKAGTWYYWSQWLSFDCFATGVLQISLSTQWVSDWS